jgi:hypothetical protein
MKSVTGPSSAKECFEKQNKLKGGTKIRELKASGDQNLQKKQQE